MLTRARGFLSATRPRAGEAVELFVETERTREVSWADGRPKDLLVTVGAGVAARVLAAGRQGFASGTDVSPEGVARLVDLARGAAAVTPPDVARRPPRPSRRRGRPAAADRALLSAPPSALLRRLGALEKKLLRSDRRITRALGLAFRESAGTRAVVSTTGVAVEEPFGGVSFSLELLGESGGQSQVSWGAAEKTRWALLDVEGTAADVRRRLLESFGAEPLTSGDWPVIVEPRVGVDFLELLSQAVTADAVQRGRSCLRPSRVGRRVASSVVTVVDDGRWTDGVGTGLWDDEGVPTGRSAVIRGGLLRTFLYDTASAARDGVNSTGNAVRAEVATPPSPGITNFYMAPGRGSAARLWAETPRAFVVRDVIGMHTADPVSGDFSVGAAGVLWEDGAVRRAVKGVTLAGNLLDLLARVDAVARDLTWQGALGAPTFRVSGLSVGGS